MAPKKQTSGDVNVDEILNSLRSFGFFQISQFLLISSMVIAINSNVYVIVFTAVQTGYQCKNFTEPQLDNFTGISKNNTFVYGTCNVDVYDDEDNTSLVKSIECLNGYEYTPSKDRSILSEWDLICQRNGLAELTQTSFIIGQCLGALIFPILTEKFGRRPMHIACGFSLMLSALLCALSPSLLIFTIGRVLSGFSEEGYVISGITAICELFATDKRAMMTGIFSLIWSCCMSIPTLIAYLIKGYGWRFYCFYASATSLFFIIEIFFLEESIRWLFVNGKVLNAKRVIKKACRQNGSEFDKVWAIAENELGENANVDENSIYTITVNLPDAKAMQPQNNLSEVKDTPDLNKRHSIAPEGKFSKFFKIITIFKYPFTRYITLINVFNWLVVNTSYNGIYMLAEDLSGNMYLNLFLLALMEMTAAAIYCVGIKKFGHKISMISCEVLGAVSLLTACSIKYFGAINTINNTVFRMLHLSAMFGIGACFGGVYIYTPELYPTDVRSIGLGIASSLSRVGSMMAPFSRVLVTYAEWAPSLLFGTCLLASTFLICFLPETSRKQLPQSMDELKESRRVKKIKVETDQVHQKDVER